MVEVKALYKRAEHWEARDPYPARHLLHLLVPETGDDLRVDATPEVARQVSDLALLTPVQVSCAIARTERNGALQLRATRIVAVSKAAA